MHSGSSHVDSESLQSPIARAVVGLVFFVTVAIIASAEEPGFEFSVDMGGPGIDSAEGIAVDDFGNVYITGLFRETADFDPDEGTLELTSSGDADIFVQKIDSEGQLVWAVSIGGTKNNAVAAIAVDGSGDVLITGSFEGTMDFDPGDGLYELSSADSHDIFIEKIDAVGHFVWAKVIGGGAEDFGNGIAVDALGNVLVTGEFRDIVDFDVQNNTATLDGGRFGDTFVLKLDSGGGFLWARDTADPDGRGFVAGQSIAVDGTGNVYTTGALSTNFIDFDPGTSTGTIEHPIQGPSVYVWKLDSSGHFIWVTTLDGESIGNSISLDTSGKVFVTGSFIFNIRGLGPEQAHSA